MRNVVNALAQPRGARESPCFIKFTSRNLLYLPLIERAFPGVPWIFLYREPLEVMSALLRNRNDFLPSGLAESGLLDEDAETVRAMRPAEFWAHVLARNYKAALQAYAPGNGRLVNYRQLPEIVWESLLGFFGATGSDEEIASMQAASRFNAKNPTRLFVDDTDAKRGVATDEMRAAVERLLRTDFERLESLRLA